MGVHKMDDWINMKLPKNIIRGTGLYFIICLYFVRLNYV